jgi:GNAT superfamily N-acetyltransferase
MGGMSGAIEVESGGTWLEAARETHGIVIGAIGALPADRLGELIALYELLDPALPRLDREAAERALSAPGVTVFAAVDPTTQRLMGVATLITAPTLTRTRAWAEDLVVHPDFRGRGAGEALMDACAEAAAATGARSIDGTVHPDRTSAVSLYRRTGWEFSTSLAVRRHM